MSILCDRLDAPRELQGVAMSKRRQEVIEDAWKALVLTLGHAAAAVILAGAVAYVVL